MMKRRIYLWLCILFSLLMAFTSCKTPTAPIDSGNGSSEAEEEYTLELEDGFRQLTIYYNRASGYENCDI